MKKRLKIYIAGPIRNPDNIQFLDNLRQGIRVSTELIMKGFAPFCPFLDFMYLFQLREGEQISVKDLHSYSIAFLPGSAAVLVLSTVGKGRGVSLELEEAVKLRIPVFYNKEVAIDYLKHLEE